MLWVEEGRKLIRSAAVLVAEVGFAGYEGAAWLNKSESTRNLECLRTRLLLMQPGARRRYWRATSDVGIGDRQASEVTRAWQQQILASYGNRFQAEVPVSVGLHEKIDLVDLKSGVAYELKVSGNNPHHEFYKDIFKVVVYNQSHDAKIRRLVFITAESGAARLQKGLGRAVIKVAPQIGFNITVEGI